MPIRHADPGDAFLHRIGRAPDPLAWPAPAFSGAGRFDDPLNAFGVLYASASRLACYLETLDTYRPDRALLQSLLAMGPDPFTPRSGLIPDDYFGKLIGRFRLAAGQRWLDVRIDAPESAAALSREPTIASLLPDLGYGKRFKPGDLLGADRRLTQTIARWAYANGYAGLAYSCSHRPRLDCWAVFAGAALTVVGAPLSIAPDDPDLIAVAREFELTISFARPA